MALPYFILPSELEVEYTLDEQKIFFSIYEELGKNIPKNKKIENIQQLSSGLKPSFIVAEILHRFDNAMRN